MEIDSDPPSMKNYILFLRPSLTWCSDHKNKALQQMSLSFSDCVTHQYASFGRDSGCIVKRADTYTYITAAFH